MLWPCLIHSENPNGLRYLYPMAPPSGPAMSNKSILCLGTIPWNTDQAWVKLRSSQPSRHLSINWVIRIPEKLSTFLRRLPAGNLRAICTSRTPFRSETKDVKVLASSALFSQQGNTNPMRQEGMWKKEYLLLSTCNYAVLRDSGSFIFLTKQRRDNSILLVNSYYFHLSLITHMV